MPDIRKWLNELGRNTQEFGGIAKELARRLEQRNAHVLATHSKIRIFIISSAEALAIARTIQNALDHDFTVTLWTDGVFRCRDPVESGEKLDQSDCHCYSATQRSYGESRIIGADSSRQVCSSLVSL